MSEPFGLYAQSLLSFLQQYKFSVLTILLLPLFRYAYLDYQGWYALGAGGLPHNAFGWLLQTLLRLRASRNLRDSSCYDVALESNELERTSFLGDQLPARTGNTPKTGEWVVPHRQLEQAANEEIKNVCLQDSYFECVSHILQALKEAISNMVESESQSLEFGPSKLEGGAPALFISPESCGSNHTSCSLSPREVFHSHCTTDGSSHAVLSAADAKLVLDRGWGERHGIGGKALGFPLGYIMIFAPRTMQEVEIVGSIRRAAARYGLEGKKLQ